MAEAVQAIAQSQFEHIQEEVVRYVDEMFEAANTWMPVSLYQVPPAGEEVRAGYYMDGYYTAAGPVAQDRPGSDEADVFCEQTVEEIDEVRRCILIGGWVQHVMVSAEGVCLLGGISYAVRTDDRRNAVRRALELFLDVHYRDEYGCYAQTLPAWNDRPQRTQAEVLDVLERAALWVKENINV